MQMFVKFWYFWYWNVPLQSMPIFTFLQAAGQKSELSPAGVTQVRRLEHRSISDAQWVCYPFLTFICIDDKILTNFGFLIVA